MKIKQRVKNEHHCSSFTAGSTFPKIAPFNNNSWVTWTTNSHRDWGEKNYVTNKFFPLIKFLEQQRIRYDVRKSTDTCEWDTNGGQSTSEFKWLLNKSGYLRSTANWSLKNTTNMHCSQLLDRIKSAWPWNATILPFFYKTVHTIWKQTIWKTLNRSQTNSNIRKTETHNQPARHQERQKKLNWLENCIAYVEKNKSDFCRICISVQTSESPKRRSKSTNSKLLVNSSCTNITISKCFTTKRTCWCSQRTPPLHWLTSVQLEILRGLCWAVYQPSRQCFHEHEPQLEGRTWCQQHSEAQDSLYNLSRSIFIQNQKSRNHRFIIVLDQL